MVRQFSFILLLLVLLSACGNKEKKVAEEKIAPTDKQETNGGDDSELWNKLMPSITKIDSYDEGRILESGQGFFVGEDLLVTKYSLVNQATEVDVQPFGEDKKYTAHSFVAFDRINDLIILKVDSIRREPIELQKDTLPNFAKSMYVAPKTGKTLQLFTGKVLNLTNIRGTRLYRITNLIRASQFGAPIFVSTGKAIGVAYSGTVNFETQSFAIPSEFILDMLRKKTETPEPLEMLKNTSNEKIAAENRKIKGLVLETDYGNITIKLFNETPEYRDNFIRLAKEHYFDSLLIHRVIKDFGIQSGAADTRYAVPGANVGWKGPGYTIPAHIVPGLYHKRGMIGSPRKPDTKNERRRSDGSQFYIVSGRTYSDKGLDELEETNNYKFSAEQRRAYKTVGGSPHLDDSYTIFGQVTSGMDVVDKIVQVETDRRWRPVEDIRIKRVRILK
ncbi:peptidylprolyl isomerase [Draconibacterium sp. IB214405]|uniref:peptidylprolyl isomerase n=1 Tax=Draconibacterium sp. IB214405 TaxID=3097352 RepID=UPI002A106C61|nr:peptidylprolyl isomerase [Draconibacterium sp. IB214405]MDX8341608.1 peptidylprolyl isomerase [Draconibacterium sp. IB214405]